MGFDLGSIASIPIVGDVLSAYGAHREAAMNRDFTAWQAGIQRDREDTAYTRKVADLQNAGLNPVLAAGGSGLGAGGMASGSMASMPSDIGGRAVSASNASALNRELVEKANYDKQTSQYQAEMANLDYEVKLSAVPELKAALINSARAASTEDSVRNEVWSGEHGDVLKYLQLLGAPANSAAGALRSLIPSLR